MALGFSGTAPRRPLTPAARLGALVLIGLLLAAGWLTLRGPGDRSVSEAVVAPDAAASPDAAPVVAPVAAEIRRAASADDGAVPEGMTRAQWDSLREQLANQPNAEAEIARVTDTMAYLSRLARYRLLRGSGADGLPEARELAAGLLARLPVRVAQHEMSLGEARRLQDALFGTLATADAARAVERDRLQAAVPATPDLAARAERDARFQRETAAVLATWKGQAPAQRDARQLESSLEALRRSVFNPAAPSSAQPATGASR